MNSLHAPGWLPSFLVPFFTLSYPVPAPAETDSFHDSYYFATGPRDLLFMVGCIAVMAVLRDAIRLGIMEPFARWKLGRDLAYTRRCREKAAVASNGNGHANGHVNGNGHANGNGHTNGNGHANGAANGHTNGGLDMSAEGVLRRKEDRQVHRKVLRFAEQAWSVVYYVITWSFGLYIYLNLPASIYDPAPLWADYPHIPIAAPVKFYYLLQTAFYIHQVLILNAEERRKDHIQMMTHHVITIALVGASYYANFTRVGCMLLALMDWCDIWLPLAKMLRYLDHSTLCDVTFVWFMVSWFVTRHALFVCVILKSTWLDCPRLIPFEWDPVRERYLTETAWMIFMALLSALQVIQMVWYWLICRIAWRVVMGQNAEDERSDDGSEEETVIEEKKNQ
ncbi:longevity assurance proteins LAG1/LAC1 [Athelia psychrophila]|uniref:Longevity assurance proteins LAG1/LAC1 n=1 Tax=Athelia psychrophila TaxID=1759441 RepID=A0A166VMH6_9AGAM|nr:longevity assurance proteins LAG1/LAC1 [Fibularhizoctonia sp. CBS 109695]